MTELLNLRFPQLTKRGIYRVHKKVKLNPQKRKQYFGDERKWEDNTKIYFDKMVAIM
jgi:hypothetical protein